MTATEAIERIRALQEITRTTGTITKRAQNEVIKALPDKELAAAAVELKKLFDTERSGYANTYTCK